MMMMSSPDYSWDKQSVPEEPKTIRVVAPATLVQDYTFDITLGGKHGNRPYTVTVPEGGVLEGEEFDIPYPSWDEYSDVADEHDDEERQREIKKTDSDDKITWRSKRMLESVQIPQLVPQWGVGGIIYSHVAM
jgi:hypothetical protein